MDIERHFMLRSNGTANGSVNWSDLSPKQAGLAAALRRAYDVPADNIERQFADLLRKLC